MSKNQRKKANMSPAMFMLLVLTAISLGTTGVLHTVMENRQLQVERETEEVEDRIKEYDRDIISLEIRLEQLGNHFDLRDALTQSETSLRKIPLSAVEDVIPSQPSVPAVASND